MLKLPGGAPMGPLALDIVLELIKQGEVTQDYLFAKKRFRRLVSYLQTAGHTGRCAFSIERS